MIPPLAWTAPALTCFPRRARVSARCSASGVGQRDGRPSYGVWDLLRRLRERILRRSPKLERQADAAHAIRLIHRPFVLLPLVLARIPYCPAVVLLPPA